MTSTESVNMLGDPSAYFQYRDEANAKYDWNPGSAFDDEQVDRLRPVVCASIIENEATTPQRKGEQLGGFVHDLIMDTLHFAARDGVDVDKEPVRRRLKDVLNAIEE